jgi:hypothetical protein
MATLSEAYLPAIDPDPFVAKNPMQYLSTLRSPYEIDLSDPGPFRSPPYRSAPPKMRVFSEMVEDLLTKGLVGPSKSPYAIPAFLVLKSAGGFWLVVDYRKVTSENVFCFYTCTRWRKLSSTLGAL